MPETGKLKIEIYREKNADELSKSLSDPGNRAENGSAAAAGAAYAAALAQRGAAIQLEADPENERLIWLTRNLDILRNYMVKLIDEDVHSRGPLRRAMKEGGPREVEASRHPACSISSEIINMMTKLFEFCDELGQTAPKEVLHYYAEAAELAMGVIRSCMVYIFNMTAPCSDETYLYVTKRENELTLEECSKTYARIVERFNEAYPLIKV